jgi:hypothetical protein
MSPPFFLGMLIFWERLVRDIKGPSLFCLLPNKLAGTGSNRTVDRPLLSYLGCTSTLRVKYLWRLYTSVTHSASAVTFIKPRVRTRTHFSLSFSHA